ncbi:MAG TPA: DUF423 domain-containing protein [Gammaproteobacteria bacterium]|nr:DUF423 domain-containing protein [Gammaproteobacteria bacterium]
MSSTGKLFALVASLLLAAATAIGAATTHGLEGRLSAQAIAAVGTAVQYQFYHGLGLLAVALLADRLPGARIRVAGWLMFAGTILFCIGIYARYLLGVPAAAPLTPIGGACMIASWLVLCFALARAGKVTAKGS